MSDTQAPETVVLTINGKQVEATPGELVIDAAERTGTYIPRFCYHPRMEPVGMCRMCIVEIDTGRGPALQPSCMIPVAPDMVVDTESAVTKKAQEGVLEFLLINHPLDCPVCDKGGECPLQDQTMSHGPGESRLVEEKRHYAKPIPISDLVDLDRERCILCDRCTRFAKDVAGDALIHFIDRGNQTQVNTFPDHPFASYFSGNTVQICPVGALTASPYRFKARPWDLDQVESTCTSCSVGCRVVVQSSRNEVVRYLGVDVDPVNWGWLCDKGRFDFQAQNHEARLRAPLVRSGDDLVEASWGAALQQAVAALRDADPDRVAVLGGARLTNESAYAWAKLAKGVLGTDHVDAQLDDGLPAEVVLGLPKATIDQVCAPGGTVLLIGPDVKEELPVLFLRLRHAVTRDGVKVVELAPRRSSFSDLAAATLLHRPGTEGEVVRALLAGGGDQEVGGVPAEALAAAAALLDAGPVTVVLGRANLADSGAGVVAAAEAIHAAHPEVRFLSALRRANVHGALDMGLAPGLLPGRTTLEEAGQWFRDGGWATVPAQRGHDARGILEAAAAGKVDVLVLLGADPLADVPDRALATKALAGARTVIAVDQLPTASVRQADVVFPAAGYAEVDGTTTNLEGRVSTVARKVTAPGTARDDWMIAVDLARFLEADLGFSTLEEIWAEIEALAPSHAGLTLEVLHGYDARDGVVIPLAGPPAAAPDEVSSTEGAAPSGPAHEGESDSGVAEAAGEAAVAAEAADDAAAKGAAEVEATEAQAEATADAAEADGDPEPEAPAAPARPALLRHRPAGEVTAPAPDAYSLRLVATRKLYDLGTLVQHSPSLAGLVTENAVHLHPHDFDKLGIEPGASVTLTAAAGALQLPAVPDAGVPRGSAAVLVNQPGPAVGTLVTAGEAVTDVRVERA
ncbi:MAG TPA: NADH-quinone oxidoreductase subunit NuoG [Acidimicrobiales bacterium]|nr:NADH-quinone oxidoreductase subunit NuoG [Acidimicrobiales bacterium]